MFTSALDHISLFNSGCKEKTVCCVAILHKHAPVRSLPIILLSWLPPSTQQTKNNQFNYIMETAMYVCVCVLMFLCES